MAIKILMPALSPTMVEGNLAKWHKKEGDKIKSGDIIAEIETDKATMEVESADAGILGKIIIPDKTEKVKVNQLIGVILEDGDDKSAIEKLIKESSNDRMPISEDNKASVTKQLSHDNKSTIANRNTVTPNRVFVSPLARRIAQQKHIDLSSIKGSGPRGRIVKEDVQGAAVVQFSGNRNMSETQIIPNSKMRKVIAQRLQQSKQNIPHFYVSADCNVTYLLRLREEINNKALKQSYRISVNDFVIKASAHALKVVPNINASWSDEGIVYYNNIDISFAVATDDGLITPIIKNADQKSLSFISNEAKELAARAKQDALKPMEFQGGTFTISNLGMYGIKEFKAIINPPQSCILAVGTSEKRPIVENEQIIIADIMTISISCDHRVIDGAVAALFMSELKQFIENPAMMLV